MFCLNANYQILNAKLHSNVYLISFEKYKHISILDFLAIIKAYPKILISILSSINVSIHHMFFFDKI